MLSRDSVPTRGRWRNEWSGAVEALRYYNFHRPSSVLASDSLLEKTYHTGYTYRGGEERTTLGSSSRRQAFDFPEMSGPEPGDGARGLLSRWFGGGALAAGPESRFQSQIKYYPDRPTGYCVTIQPYLEAADNGSLKITISDLDHPSGIRSGSQTWNINWVAPARSRRGSGR